MPARREMSAAVANQPLFSGKGCVVFSNAAAIPPGSERIWRCVPGVSSAWGGLNPRLIASTPHGVGHHLVDRMSLRTQWLTPLAKICRCSAAHGNARAATTKSNPKLISLVIHRDFPICRRQIEQERGERREEMEEDSPGSPIRLFLRRSTFYDLLSQPRLPEPGVFLWRDYYEPATRRQTSAPRFSPTRGRRSGRPG